MSLQRRTQAGDDYVAQKEKQDMEAARHDESSEKSKRRSVLLMKMTGVDGVL